MKRKLFAILMAACLLLSLTVCVSAAGFYEDTTDGSLTGSTFATGTQLRHRASVDGIAFLAGRSIHSSGSNEYVAAAAQVITLEGKTEKDAFLAGQDLSVQGDVGRDLFAASQTLDIMGDVGGSIYAAAESIVIQGKVAGDVYLSAEKIVVSKDAVIGGRLYYPSNAKVTANADILSNAVVQQVEEHEEEARHEKSLGRELLEETLEKIGSFVGLAAVALVLLWLTPLWEKVDSRYTGQSFSKYATAFGIGFGVLVGVPIASVVLMITGVGLRLAFLLLMVYIAALIGASLFAEFFVGSLVWRKALKKAPKLWVELILGVALWTVASCIPVVSFLTGFVGVPFGLGVVTLLIAQSKQKAVPQQAALPEGKEE